LWKKEKKKKKKTLRHALFLNHPRGRGIKGDVVLYYRKGGKKKEKRKRPFFLYRERREGLWVHRIGNKRIGKGEEKKKEHPLEKGRG